MSERGNKVLHYLDACLGVPACCALSLVRFFRCRERPTVPGSVGFLIFNAIGDAVLASAAIDACRNAFPQCRIVLFLSDGNRGMAELLAGYDHVEVLPLSKPHRAVSMIRKQGLDVLVDTNQWIRISALFSFFSGTRWRIGFSTKGMHRHMLYDNAVIHLESRHELDNYLALVHAVTGEVSGRPLLDKGKLLATETPGLPDRFVVFHPWGSGYRSYMREWPAENWVRLAGWIKAKGFEIVITGGPGEERKSLELKELISGVVPVTAMAGKLSLLETGALVLKAEAVVSVNTGIMHVASALGIPVVALNGPTNEKRWGAVGPNVVNISVTRDDGGAYLHLGAEYHGRKESVMSKISVFRVEQALRRLLSV